MLILDSGSVHNSDAARSFGCCSPLSSNNKTTNIVQFFSAETTEKELEECFVSNLYAQLAVHELVDRAPTSCSHTAAPAFSVLKPQPVDYEVMVLQR